MDAGLGDRFLAADGAVTGVGEIDGRPVAVAAYDFTVMAGSMGAVGESKIARMRAHAVRQRIPFVWLLDSAGARIQSTSGSTLRGRGRAVPRAGRDERRRADGRGDARALRGRAPRTSPGSPTSCRW